MMTPPFDPHIMRVYRPKNNVYLGLTQAEILDQTRGGLQHEPRKRRTRGERTGLGKLFKLRSRITSITIPLAFVGKRPDSPRLLRAMPFGRRAIRRITL